MRFLVCGALVFLLGVFIDPAAKAQTSSPNDELYLSIIEEALKSDINQVDFLRLRTLYTHTSFFDVKKPKPQ